MGKAIPLICHRERSACPACHTGHACHERSVVERSVELRYAVQTAQTPAQKQRVEKYWSEILKHQWGDEVA